MIKRAIQVGDDLSGRTLYFTFPDDLGDWIDSSVTSGVMMQTDNGGSLTYSKSGGVTTAAAEDVYITSPDETTTEIYNQWAWTVDVNKKYLTLSDDFGIVTTLTDTTLWDYVKVAMPETISNMYIGTTPVTKVYKGSHLFSNIIAGSHYVVIKEFTIYSTGTFEYEDGQTWNDWISQKKYWDSSDNFVVTSWGDITFTNGSGNTATLTNASYSSIAPTDLIDSSISYHGALACLSADTLIKTLNGNVPISSLKIGHQIENGNIVTAIVRHIREGYFKLIFENGDIIKASSDHIFILNDNIIKTTRDLKVGDMNISKIEYVRETTPMYEIKTSTNKYELFNGIICKCEDI